MSWVLTPRGVRVWGQGSEVSSVTLRWGLHPSIRPWSGRHLPCPGRGLGRVRACVVALGGLSSLLSYTW